MKSEVAIISKKNVKTEKMVVIKFSFFNNENPLAFIADQNLRCMEFVTVILCHRNALHCTILPEVPDANQAELQWIWARSNVSI